MIMFYFRSFQSRWSFVLPPTSKKGKGTAQGKGGVQGKDKGGGQGGGTTNGNDGGTDGRTDVTGKGDIIGIPTSSSHGNTNTGNTNTGPNQNGNEGARSWHDQYVYLMGQKSIEQMQLKFALQAEKKRKAESQAESSKAEKSIESSVQSTGEVETKNDPDRVLTSAARAEEIPSGSASGSAEVQPVSAEVQPPVSASSSSTAPATATAETGFTEEEMGMVLGKVLGKVVLEGKT